MATQSHPGYSSAAAQVRSFKITEEVLGAGRLEFRIEGELDLAVADQLRARLEAAVEDGMEVSVALDRCDFIDSTGIAVLIRSRRRLAEKGGRLAIRNPSERVARTLGMVGIDLDDVGRDQLMQAA
jgi:anti-sigma B factor antagonist